jgi:hypothetical protein
MVAGAAVAVGDGLAVGLWAAGYSAAFILAVLGLHALIRFLTPCNPGDDDMHDLSDAAADRAMAREACDARPGGPPATPAMGGGLGGAGLSLVFLEDHGGSDDPSGPPDPGISTIPVADACQSETNPSPTTFWRPGDVVAFDNGRTRFDAVRLMRPRERRPGWWKTEMGGVDLHEVYFKRAD